MSGKAPLILDEALTRIAAAIESYPKAALFELAEAGHTTTFRQAIACMISVRTLDETTLVLAQRLFKQAGTPEAMQALGVEAIDRLIHACNFHEAKARQIHAIATRAVAEFDGTLPCDRAVLLSLPGIGPKCANLVLGIACGQPYISVDIHVHRVTNRWGYIQASTPEGTLAQLEAKVPQHRWIDVNRLLMPFGKHICTGTLPRCSTCPVLEMCEQVGVRHHR